MLTARITTSEASRPRRARYSRAITRATRNITLAALATELEPFRAGAPSAERQAEYFYRRLGDEMQREYGPRVRLVKIKVIQEPDAWAEYEP